MTKQIVKWRPHTSTTWAQPSIPRRHEENYVLIGGNAFANILLCFVLAGAGNAFRILPLETTLEFWTVFPPVLLPLWLRYHWDVFLWTKLLSLIPCAIIAFVEFRMGVDQRFAQVGAFAILSINIVEAILMDLLSKSSRKVWSPLNAIIGLLLILAELPSVHTIRIGSTETRDFLWSLGGPWILAYTLWNWMLVCNSYPYALGRHTAVLLAPIVLCLENGWDIWLETRCSTLASYALLRSTFYTSFRELSDVEDPFGSTTQKRVVQVLAFLCNLLLLTALLYNKSWQQDSYYYLNDDGASDHLFPEAVVTGRTFQEWNMHYTILDR